MKVAFTILGEPASKANSRQIVMMGRGKNARPAVIKSEKARDYEAAAMPQIPLEARLMLAGPVIVRMTIFYATERPDLDESVVLDVLQAKFAKVADGGAKLMRAGVYVNDRQVREKHIFHAIDRTTRAPRSRSRSCSLPASSSRASRHSTAAPPAPPRTTVPAHAPLQPGVDPF
jgi:hypothetical protein